jgi:hypothetical protein
MKSLIFFAFLFVACISVVESGIVRMVFTSSSCDEESAIGYFKAASLTQILSSCTEIGTSTGVYGLDLDAPEFIFPTDWSAVGYSSDNCEEYNTVFAGTIYGLQARQFNHLFLGKVDTCVTYDYDAKSGYSSFAVSSCIDGTVVTLGTTQVPSCEDGSLTNFTTSCTQDGVSDIKAFRCGSPIIPVAPLADSPVDAPVEEPVAGEPSSVPQAAPQAQPVAPVAAPVKAPAKKSGSTSLLSATTETTLLILSAVIVVMN